MLGLNFLVYFVSGNQFTVGLLRRDVIAYGCIGFGETIRDSKFVLICSIDNFFKWLVGAAIDLNTDDSKSFALVTLFCRIIEPHLNDKSIFRVFYISVCSFTFVSYLIISLDSLALTRFGASLVRLSLADNCLVNLDILFIFQWIKFVLIWFYCPYTQLKARNVFVYAGILSSIIFASAEPLEDFCFLVGLNYIIFYNYLS